MSERLVLFRDRQELQSADLANIGGFTQESIDHVILDTIETGKAYSGLTVEKTGASELTVSTGRLYSSGAVYGLNTTAVLDVFNKIPLVTKKRIAVVAWGQTQNSDVQPRDFLIDAQTGETQPENVAMLSARVCTISVIDGIEAPDPSYPVISSDVTVVAFVLLDTNGVVSVEQWTANRVSNLRAVNSRTGSLEAWKSTVGAQVDNLRTDLATLANATALGLSDIRSKISEITSRLDELNTKANTPAAAYLKFITNHFLDASDDDPARTGWDAVVGEGIRLPYAASDVGQLALLNPQDVNARVSGDMVLPVYTNVARILTGVNNDELRMAVYSYQTVSAKQYEIARQRLRYGNWFTVCTNSQWWQGGQFDFANGVFTRAGETFVVNAADLRNALVNHRFVRVQQFWRDSYTETYWGLETTTHNLAGQMVAQTWLNSQDGWITAIAPLFTRLAATGNVTFMICETTLGMPDLEKSVMKTSVAVGSLKTDRSQIAIPPTFLKAGKRYALVIVTAGDHYIGTTQSANGVLQGTLFIGTDGGYFQGVLDKDLCIDFYFARWSKARYAIDCAPFVLAGGIHNIDINWDGVTPAATQLHFEVQINGIWRPLSQEQEVDLSALPPLLPLRIVFTGSSDVMPSIGVGDRSGVFLSRPKTAAVWTSKPRVLGSGTTGVKIQFRLEDFNDTVHDFTASLRTGASYATTETADVVSDFTLPDGAIIRTMTFNITSATQYYVRSELSVSSINSTFHVAEMNEYALA